MEMAKKIKGNMKTNKLLLLFCMISFKVFFFDEQALAKPQKSSSVNLFHIERNKNKNQVHYAIRLNKNCEPAVKKPVYAYWLNLEAKKLKTSPVKWYQKAAYGIKEQKKNAANQWKIILKALPTKKIYVRHFRNKKSDQCSATAWTQVAGKRARLNTVYVFAKEKSLIPKVKYVDIFGKLANGTAIKERIIP